MFIGAWNVPLLGMFYNAVSDVLYFIAGKDYVIYRNFVIHHNCIINRNHGIR